MTAPRWLDLKINPGFLFTVGCAVVAMAVGWSELRAANDRQDHEISALREADKKLQDQLRETGAAIRADVADIKQRSDQILEKLVDKQQSTVERVVRVETKVDEILKAVAPASGKRM